MTDFTCNYHVPEGDGTRPCGRPAIKVMDQWLPWGVIHIGWCAEHFVLNPDAANGRGAYFARVRDV